MGEGNLDISIVMPCLDEVGTIGTCVDGARSFLTRRDLAGEVVVVDNGSSDGSGQVAARHGAVLIEEPRRGYGRAVRTGFEHARGRVIVMGDCDTTYDFAHMDALVDPLLSGRTDMMVGDRFAGQMEPGAMPWLHRVGVPLLSWCGRLRCGSNVHDFHCGLRGMTADAYRRCTLRTDGMEFATEMILEATRQHLRIGQVSVPLRRGPRGRRPKLRTFADGWRHLQLIMRDGR